MLSAMILAAGRGERMRPLTDHVPKPLIHVAGRSLLGWHLERLAAVGVDEVVINHAWLGKKIEAEVQAYWGGRRPSVQFSAEVCGLETAGGILQALSQLSDPFILINGDVFTEFDYHDVVIWAKTLPESIDARLLLVPNPPYYPSGDFNCTSGVVTRDGVGLRTTYSGISVLRHALFQGYPHGVCLPLREVLYPAIQRRRIGGVVSYAFWADVGTPERLGDLRARYQDMTPIDVA